MLDGFQLEYNAMQEGAFRLLLAKREQLTTGIAFVSTLTDYWSASAELDGLLEGAAPRGGALTSPSVASASGMPASSPTSDSH